MKRTAPLTLTTWSRWFRRFTVLYEEPCSDFSPQESLPVDPVVVTLSYDDEDSSDDENECVFLKQVSPHDWFSAEEENYRDAEGPI